MLRDGWRATRATGTRLALSLSSNRHEKRLSSSLAGVARGWSVGQSSSNSDNGSSFSLSHFEFDQVARLFF